MVNIQPIMNIILQFVYITTFVVVTNGQTCEPCEENKPCTISFTSRNVHSSVNQFIWKYGGVTAAVCYSQNGLECLLTPEARGLLFPTIEKEPDDVVNTSVMFTANRLKKLTSEAKWELNVLDVYQGLKQLYTCDVKIYKSVPQPSCTYEASNKGLEVKCFSSFVYPTSVCSFNVRFDQTILNQTALHYNHTITNTDPIYYTTECSVFVPKKLLMPGVLKYQVAMFPNISISSTIFARNEFEKTEEGIIKIEFPSIKTVACPDFVEVGNFFNCTCERTDQSDIPTEVYWYRSLTDVLFEIPIENETVHVCKAENNFGWLSTLNYSPRTKENKSSNELALFSGKSSNCSNKCYGDKELFLKKDEGYFCLLPHNGKNLHEWCLTINASDNVTMESNACHNVCVYLKSVAEGQNDKVIFIICGTIAVISLGIGILFILKQLKDLEKEKRNAHQPSAIPICNKSDNVDCVVLRGANEETEANDPLLAESSNCSEQLEPSHFSVPEDSACIIEEVVVSEPNGANAINNNQQQEYVLQTQGVSQLKDVSSLSPSKPSTNTSVIVKFAKEMPNRSVRLREAEVSLNTSIILLKQDLVDLYNIPAEEQLWYLTNKLMEDDKFLRDYEISGSVTIVMKAKQLTVQRDNDKCLDVCVVWKKKHI